MKAYIIFTLLLWCPSVAYSQTVDWANGFGGNGEVNGRGLAVDASNNSYIVGDCFGTANFGNFTLSSALPDIFAIKVDPSGAVLWAKSFGTTGSGDGYGVALDSSANSYFTGYFSSSLAPSTLLLLVVLIFL